MKAPRGGGGYRGSSAWQDGLLMLGGMGGWARLGWVLGIGKTGNRLASWLASWLAEWLSELLTVGLRSEVSISLQNTMPAPGRRDRGDHLQAHRCTNLRCRAATSTVPVSAAQMEGADVGTNQLWVAAHPLELNYRQHESKLKHAGYNAFG